MVRSAGILLYQFADGVEGAVEVWLGHMGGPFWAKKDAAAWSIPKGLYDETEDPLAAAVREFEEEIGAPAPQVEYVLLGEFRQASGKRLTVFTAESGFAPSEVVSNTFELEWPPHSGRLQQFPEIDNARWFDLEAATTKIVKGQVPALNALEERLRRD